jgi:signal transduction histidine kinase
MTQREEILGRGIFEVFPDNPAEPTATGERNLRASLERVVRYQTADTMQVQKYDIRRPELAADAFEERYWSPVNTPVLSAAKQCLYIIRRVEDVTEFVRLKRLELELDKLTEELGTRAASLEYGEIFSHSKKQNEANRKLQRANLELEAFSYHLSREKAEALSALRESQEQLLQSQKLEAVGQLAGGIAHDFNNLLTVIIGYSELVLRTTAADHPHLPKLQEIKKAARHAASLTRQLLAFSRKQVLQPKVLELNSIVPEIERMLRRVIGEDIELRTTLQPDLGKIEADPGQVEQVIMNLAVNARDAMPAGGKLTIETADVYLDETYTRHHVGSVPGPYVMLAISDTGAGMDEETQSRIFEPFFTTKPLHKGTGLGLSTVYGIVKQSGGNIWVYSEVGRGTTFKIYLPRTDKGLDAYKQTELDANLLRGNETVLLVEDADSLRKLAREVLETNGYTVLEAASGLEALRICGQSGIPIHLLLTDVVMPEMSGRELANQLAPLHPQMRVLYMSGYTDDTIVHHGVLEPGINFIQKPFTPDQLATRVREVLNA